MVNKRSKDERREFYRIQDEIALRYEFIPAHQSISEHYELNPDAPFSFQLLSELRQIDLDNTQLLRAMQDKARNLSNYIKGINRKIELLTRFMVTELTAGKLKIHQVDLSGGGIGFTCQEKVELDQPTRVEMILFPDCVGIIAYGRVISCIRDCTTAKEQYHVGVGFDRIREHDQDSIVKHVLHMQSIELRKAKELAEKD